MPPLSSVLGYGPAEEGHLSSLGTISVEMERFHELRKNQEDVCDKVINILVQKDGHMDFVG